MNQGVVDKIAGWNDEHTQGVENVNSDKVQIYEGHTYFVTIEAGTLTVSATEDYQLQTPSTKTFNIKSMFMTGIDAPVEFSIRRPTSSAPVSVATSGSQSVRLSNMNDVIGTPAESNLKYNGVAYSSGDDGAEWLRLHINARSTKFYSGEDDFQLTPSEEFILAPATTYIFRFFNESTTTAANEVTLKMSFSEEENRY